MGIMLYRLFFAAVLSLTSTVVSSQTKQTQLLEFVRAQLPAGYSLVEDSFKFKDFPREAGGRMSVIGQMRLDVNLLAKMRRQDSALGYADWPFLKKNLALRGYTDAGDVGRAMRNFGMGLNSGNRLLEYAVVVPAGLTFPFDGELPYIETVSGIRLSGRLSYETPDGLLPQEVREPHYVTGTPQSYQLVEQVALEIENQRRNFENNMQAIADHFAGPLLIRDRDGGALVRVTSDEAAQLADTATWNAEQSSGGPVLIQFFAATGTALQRFKLKETTFHEGDEVGVSLGVRVGERKPFINQSSVYLSVSHPDGTLFDLADSAFPLQPWESGHARGWVQLVPDPMAAKATERARAPMAAAPMPTEAAAAEDLPALPEGAESEADADFQTALLSSAWQGPVSQPGGRPYSLHIVPGNGAFDIAYPELNCGGNWTFNTVINNTATLDERITWGGGCGQGGFVTLTGNADHAVAFEWFDSPGGRRCCTGRLVPAP